MANFDISLREASINAALKPGYYRLIRADGAESVHVGKPTIRAIQLLIGCNTLDAVTIDQRKQTVMFVDDTGMLDGKPVNAKATALHQGICQPGTVWAIHGDVVIFPAGGLA